MIRKSIIWHAVLSGVCAGAIWAAVLAAVPIAKAETPLPECADPQTTAQMNACAAAEYRRADLALNAVWNRVMPELQRQAQEIGPLPTGEPDPATALRTAQRAWIAYRDANCAWHSSMGYGGTIRTIFYYGCMSDMTQQRTREIEETVEMNR